MMDSRDRAALTRTLQAIYREIGRATDRAVQRFAPGGRVPTRAGGTGHSQGAEPPLGTPDTDGKALVSTIAGVRSWAAKQAEHALLTALSALSSTGLIARTGSGAVATRTLTAGSTKIAIADGNGVAGNPTVDLGTVAPADVTGFDEQVRDVIGAALVAGSNVTITVNDAGDTITIAATGGGGGSALAVEEVDGSPTDSAVTKIVVPNGWLAIAAHVATLAPTLDKIGTAVADVSLGSHKLTNVTDPASAQDAATKAYVDAQVVAGGGGATITRGADAARPAAGNAGALYLPTDGFAAYEDNGASWQAFGPLFPLTTPPAIAALTWVNQGAATATETNDGLTLTAPASAGDNLRALVQAVPSAPYTRAAGFLSAVPGSNFASAGLVLRESSSGKMIAFGVIHNAGMAVAVQKWTNATTFSAEYTRLTCPGGALLWLRWRDDATTRYAEVSADGQHWWTLHSVGRTDFCTPDQIGIVANSNQGTYPSGLTLLSWA